MTQLQHKIYLFKAFESNHKIRPNNNIIINYQQQSVKKTDNDNNNNNNLGNIKSYDQLLKEWGLAHLLIFCLIFFLIFFWS